MHFITFTRKLGAGGTQVARQTAERLGYRFYDTEAIEAAAQELGFLQDVREIDEKPPTFLRSVFSQRPAVGLARLNAVVYELAKGGDAVFVGRGCHILLKSFRCALHVRVTASREVRLRTLRERGYPGEAAARAIEQSDRERAAFIRFAFGVDWDSPELYDLVLNLDNLSCPLAVELVVQLARSEEIRDRSVDALAALERLALTSRVEAALMEGGFTQGALLLVRVELPGPGRIRLTGFAENAASRAQVAEVVRAVKGVREVDNQLGVVPVGRFT